MKQVTLNVSPREQFGRSASRHMRRDGVVPAIIYGESGVRHLSVNAHEFGMAYRQFSGSAALLELKAEKDSVFAIIQELQRNPRNDDFVHIDFKEIVRGKDMEADIPVHTRGTPSGVRNYGGVLEVSADTLRVRCRPRDLPEFILIDVSELDIGRSIHLEGISAPEGVTFLDDPDLVIASCVGATIEEEPEEKEVKGVEAEGAGEGEAAEEGEEESEEKSGASSDE